MVVSVHGCFLCAGNIFHHRPDLQAFNKLPPQKRNPYHIKMEDEGPYGNDEIRCFVLSALSSKRVSTPAAARIKWLDQQPCVILGLGSAPPVGPSRCSVGYTILLMRVGLL